MHLIHVVRKRANWLPYCALVDFLKNFFCLCHLCTKKSSKLQRYVVCFNFFSFRKLSGDHFLPAGLFFFWTHHHGKQGMLAEQPIFCCCLYACIRVLHALHWICQAALNAKQQLSGHVVPIDLIANNTSRKQIVQQRTKWHWASIL